MQSRGASEGTFDSVPKDTLSNLHKDGTRGCMWGCTKECT